MDFLSRLVRPSQTGPYKNLLSMVIALPALSVSLQITLMAQNSDLCSALTVSVEIAASTYQEVKFNGLPQFDRQLQAIGIGDEDRQKILRHLKSPLRLLSELVVDPEEFLYAMQDCQVVFSGSRGGGYFLPACVSAESDWDFYVHPNHSCWLRFALYLAQIGVEWTIHKKGPVENLGQESSRFSYDYPGNNPVLSGTMTARGCPHKVQLITHRPEERSSMVPITYFHSSVVQCIITGSGAFNMYSRLTNYGESRAWEPRDNTPRDKSLQKRAQLAIDKYIARGIKYVGSVSSDPAKVPPTTRRWLGDVDTMCVPFAEYLSDPGRKHKADLDLELIKDLGWDEHVAHLEYVDLDGTTPHQNIGSGAPKAIDVPIYNELQSALACQSCALDYKRLKFCERHVAATNQSSLVRMLLWRLFKYGGEYRGEILSENGGDSYSII